MHVYTSQSRYSKFRNGDGHIVDANLGLERSRSGKLGAITALQLGVGAVEWRYGNVKAAIEVVIDVVDEEGGGELVSAHYPVDTGHNDDIVSRC